MKPFDDRRCRQGPCRSDGAQALSGGQTLIPTMKQRLAAPSVLVSLTGIAELQGVCIGDGGLHIGAATPHAVVAREAKPSTIQRSRPLPVASAIRRSARAAPSAALSPTTTRRPAIRRRCWPPAATVVTNKRKIAADDYFQGLFSTALAEGEFITEVVFPIPEKAAYVKFNQPASRFALTGVFVAKLANGVRVGVTGAGNDGVFRWSEAEAALSANFSAGAIAGLSVDPSGMNADLHGSAAYRANLVKVLTGRAVTAAS